MPALEGEPQTAWSDGEGGLGDTTAAATQSFPSTGGEWEWEDDTPSTLPPTAPPPAALWQPWWPNYPPEPEPPPPWPPLAPGQEVVCFVGSISTERVPNVVLPLGDSNSSSSNGVTLYFLNANLNEQCSAAAAPPSWSGGPLMGASQGAGDAVPGKGPGWELDGGGMHLWSPEGDGDRDGGGDGDAAPPPLDMSMQPVYGSPGDGGDSPMERRILLDVSMYTASIPDCIIGAEVTGVLLSGLEDDTRLPVLRLLDIVVRVNCFDLPLYVEPLLPRDGEDVLQLSMLAVPVAVATTTGEELQPSLTAQQVADAWLGPDGLAAFLEQCSLGRVALLEAWRQQQGLEDAVAASRGVVNSVSLEDVISLSRSTAVGAALAQPQVYGKAAQQHALCMYLVAQDTMRAERSFTDQHEHRLMVFPEDVLEAARQRCPGAEAAADADAAAAQDVYEATGLPVAYSKASFCKANECKATAFLAAPTAADGTPMALDQVVLKAAVRVLGLQVGLQDAKTQDGGPDATSGLSGAPTCYNGPQGYVVGWLEVDFDEEVDLNNLADWAEPREYPLSALGSLAYCLMRVNMRDDRNNDVYWVVFRMSDPSLGLYSAPGGQHQVVLYRMNQQRADMFLGEYDDPAVWGPATDGVAPLVAPLRMGGAETPQGYLCVRFDEGSVDMEDRTARVQLCAAVTPDAPCCSPRAPEFQVQLPSPPAASPPPAGEPPLPVPSYYSPSYAGSSPPTAYPPNYPSPPPAYFPGYTAQPPPPPPSEHASPPGYGSDSAAQGHDSQELRRSRRLRLR